MKKVYVVILNYNGWEDTIKCIESLSRIKDNSRFDIETLVIDNASTNDSVKKLDSKLSEIVLLRNSQNLGFTGGVNEGIRYALKNGADFIMMLNNDTRVDEGLVSYLLDGFEDPKVGAVVPKIYFEKGFEFHKNKYKKEELGKVIWYAGGRMDWKNLNGENRGVDEVDVSQFDIEEKTELATGCCLMIKAQIFNSIGVLDDRYFLYYEDADLSQRIKNAGYTILYQPKAIVWHKNAGSGGGSGSELQDYYITRNRLLFGMKYAPIRTKIALIRESINLLKKGRSWQKKAILDYFTRNFGKGSFPV